MTLFYADAMRENREKMPGRAKESGEANMRGFHSHFTEGGLTSTGGVAYR